MLRRWVHPIGNIPLDQAALIEPLSVGYHAFVRSGAKPGDVALIGGAGPIGLLTAAVLKANGLTVIVSEPSPLRRQKALDAGVADHALDPAELDVAQEVRRISDGRGADVAFECSSVNVVLDTLLDAVRPGGVIVVVAIWSHPAQLDLHRLVLKEVDLRGTIAYMCNHPDAIAPESVNLVEALRCGIYCVGSCSVGGLIQAMDGISGGLGGLRTNRSGWAA